MFFNPTNNSLGKGNRLFELVFVDRLSLGRIPSRNGVVCQDRRLLDDLGDGGVLNDQLKEAWGCCVSAERKRAWRPAPL